MYALVADALAVWRARELVWVLTRREVAARDDEIARVNPSEVDHDG